MLTPQVGRLLRTAAVDPGLHGCLCRAATYDDLAREATAAGIATSPAELKDAFQARDARKLSGSMMAAGVMTPRPLPAASDFSQDVWQAVDRVDLQPVWTQLVHRKAWDPARATQAEHRYRRFLYLAVAHPDLDGVPTSEIDEFWHQHILNTRKYSEDCQRLNGEFIHHFPSSGNDQEESEMLSDAFFDMWITYESVFGEPYEETIWDALVSRWPEISSPQLAAA